ncbi:MAG: anthranilate synthase component I [Oscillochloridaceae bacterium]|nr:anthranilate synthase component I [Chloroflexaceae bacterium]MDW8389424.1 anthranilate synthase component I [Oscillochloridaceae bacterium]
MYTPTLEEVRALRGQGNLCPIYREILADLETPVSAYLKVAQGAHSFLLESVEGGQHIARYSFIGSDPYLTLRLDRGVAQALQGGYKQTLTYNDPLVVLGSYLSAYRPVRLPDLPRFVGGAVGYLSYETASYFERLPVPEPCDYQMPEGFWMFVDTLLIFDHLRHKLKVLSHVHLDAEDLEAEYRRATARIEALAARLRQPVPPAARLGARELEPRNYEPHSPVEPPRPRPAPVSNVTREQYHANVLRAKEYILAGDIFQVVPSQRFTRPTSADPITIYRALRTINPSPYMFLLRTGEGDLVGASPELLVRVQEGEVQTHPIAGTRRRGRDMAEDAALAEELLNDEKERAEHLMLVDLGRNDLGRVSEPGTVRVPTFMIVEKYSHVMHLVSHVTGRLRSDMTALDALRACFPAGTVSGAPKIRAMEIIAELEGARRGVYAGCVGHVGFNGDLDTCIALRTLVIQNGVAYMQAGGGVVADSDPEAEYQESCNKAAALLRAIDMAEELV